MQHLNIIQNCLYKSSQFIATAMDITYCYTVLFAERQWAKTSENFQLFIGVIKDGCHNQTKLNMHPKCGTDGKCIFSGKHPRTQELIWRIIGRKCIYPFIGRYNLNEFSLLYSVISANAQAHFYLATK